MAKWDSPLDVPTGRRTTTNITILATEAQLDDVSNPAVPATVAAARRARARIEADRKADDDDERDAKPDNSFANERESDAKTRETRDGDAESDEANRMTASGEPTSQVAPELDDPDAKLRETADEELDALSAAMGGDD